MSRMSYVVARDSDGCDVAINQQLTRREARQVFNDWLTDEELRRAGAVRVQICDEATDECIEDEPVEPVKFRTVAESAQVWLGEVTHAA